MSTTVISTIDYIRILPELTLAVFGIFVMLVDPLIPQERSKKPLGVIAVVGSIVTLLSILCQARYPGIYDGTGFFGMVRVDSFSLFFHVLIVLITLAVLLISFEYLDTQRIKVGEYYGLILFGTLGMCLMSSAIELVLIFIALEISSIATYVLAGMRRYAAESAESSLKYFLLGSFATAFFLYGIAMMFGATGSTNIYTIADALRAGGTPISSPALVYTAVALMFVGLGFKVAAAPFHIWTPDVYEGAPSPIVALMSTGPKAAAFAVLLRVLFAMEAPGWFWVIWISAALSMTLGNIGALVQNNVKRLLAYSSIAHAGYLLVAFAAAKEAGISAAIFYAASYAAMNVGAFAVISHFANAGEKYITLDDYAGLGRRSPLLAGILTVFLLSLIGIPLTGGFFAKFYVFTSALQSHLVWLTIIGVINSAIGAYYYLRVIIYMYMRDERETVPLNPVPFGLALAMSMCLVATIYLGIMPNSIVQHALKSAQDLMR